MEKALDFLSKHKNVVLATAEDGKPKVRVLQIMRQEKTVFYFSISREKAVYKQLQQNPHVEFITSDGDISVRVAGEASFDIPSHLRKQAIIDIRLDKSVVEFLSLK